MTNEFNNEAHANFHSRLESYVVDKLGGKTSKLLARFARQLYVLVPDSGLLSAGIDDIVQSTLFSWQYVEQGVPSQMKLLVFNPTIEEHGWQTNHTHIAILTPDMPFLVDSLKIELKQQGVLLTSLHNAVLEIARDEQGVARDLKDVVHRELEEGTQDPSAENQAAEEPSTDDDQSKVASELVYRREAFVLIEINRQQDDGVRHRIERALWSVIRRLKVIVYDFQNMLNATKSLIDDVENVATIDAQERAEATAFLEWLMADHFTFLGSKAYQFIDEGNKKAIKPLAQTALGWAKIDRELDCLESVREQIIDQRSLLIFTKSSTKSPFHRSVYPDVVIVRKFDQDGKLLEEVRFIGLYTSRVYNQSCRNIPYLRGKINAVLSWSGYLANSHSAKSLLQNLESYPREELFQNSSEALYHAAMSIINNEDHPKLQSFVRLDPYQRFVSVLIFIPRDSFNTAVRLRFQALLTEVFSVQELDFSTLISESLLARVHFILRVDPTSSLAFDLQSLTQRLTQAARSWEDEFTEKALDSFGEERGYEVIQAFGRAFPAAYREDYSASIGLYDAEQLESLNERQTLLISFCHVEPSIGNEIRIKFYYRDEQRTLSDIIPILENMGFVVIYAKPYEIDCASGDVYFITDFRLQCSAVTSEELADNKEEIKAALAAVWTHQMDSDRMNRLVVIAQLTWREVIMLRAYGQYLKQIRGRFSQHYIQDVLCHHAAVTRELVDLFVFYFDPTLPFDQLAEQQRIVHLLNAIDGVDNLDEDRILRYYLKVISATQRTNYFWRSVEGDYSDCLSLKIAAQQIPDTPQPAPATEIFVYSPCVEGVHLRGGLVARGGIRWSDRKEDYRTEVLGLMKAQQVKNSVIVPVGAKGGFYVKPMLQDSTTLNFQDYGRSCYETFIGGLLEITDNLIDGKPVTPKHILARDGEDPYLVVAADKGTATFSDTANEVAEQYAFWLRDAFASGGSQGYDHKKMGITARGAWVCVQRLFRELGLDVQSQRFSVVGIGDMSGDVFGNGMLLSETIELVAAFNHQHIFIDPTPDPNKSHQERQRLFGLPKSQWTDYDSGLISEGGGVFSRASKYIEITPAMRARFKIETAQLTPNQLIHALLQAPVDLIWNGGIGTYIKSHKEQHADVGDKANDEVRVNGAEVNARVIVEGGNLGLTQLGRVEFSEKGGLCNTDFIDNAGGVACSDLEVNIKILLNELVTSGQLTMEQRNEMLVDMTDAVTHIVLKSNYRQVQAISLAQVEVVKRMEEYRRFVMSLETEDRFDRRLESFPADEDMMRRKNTQEGLWRPELAVLLAYAKSYLKEKLVAPVFTEDPYLRKEVSKAFPGLINKQYSEALFNHKLIQELIATQLANTVINMMGITFVKRMEDAAGADAVEATKSFIAVRDIFDVMQIWGAIEALDNKVAAEIQLEMMLTVVRLMRSCCRWLLRNFRCELDVQVLVSRFKPRVMSVWQQLPTLFSGEQLEHWQGQKTRYLDAGVPELLAHRVAGVRNLTSVLGLIQAAETVNQPLDSFVQVYFGLAERLQLYWLAQEIEDLGVRDHWEALAREALRDDLQWQQRALTIGLLQLDGTKGVLRQLRNWKAGIEQEAEQEGMIPANGGSEENETGWFTHHFHLVERWHRLIEEIKATRGRDFAIFSVALRELMDLAQSVSHASSESSSKSSQ